MTIILNSASGAMLEALADRMKESQEDILNRTILVTTVLIATQDKLHGEIDFFEKGGPDPANPLDPMVDGGAMIRALRDHFERKMLLPHGTVAVPLEKIDLILNLVTIGNGLAKKLYASMARMRALVSDKRADEAAILEDQVRNDLAEYSKGSREITEALRAAVA